MLIKGKEDLNKITSKIIYMPGRHFYLHVYPEKGDFTLHIEKICPKPITMKLNESYNNSFKNDCNTILNSCYFLVRPRINCVYEASLNLY